MHKIDKKTWTTNNFGFFVYIAFAVLMIVVLLSKVNLHVDEVYTYRFANSLSQSRQFEEGITYEPASQVFQDYMTTNDSNRFDYNNVLKWQATDSHPPIYSLLVHTVCSIFPNSFSIWYAGLINIVFSLLTLFFVRKLFRILIENRMVYELLSVAFVLSAGILSATSYLRMYVMAMFAVTLLSYLIVNEVGKKSNWKFYLSVFLSVILASLTHYYCIIYMGFLFALYCLFLLSTRRWKPLFAFCGTAFASLALTCLLYPAMLKTLFFSARGTEAIKNLTAGSSYFERIASFYGFFNQQLFGGYLGFLLFAVGFGLLYMLLFRREEKVLPSDSAQPDHNIIRTAFGGSEIIWKYALLLTPSSIYFLIVTKIAAYQTDRYVFPIYAVTFVWVLSLVSLLASKIFARKTFAVVLCATLSIVTTGSLQNCMWPYLYRSSSNLLEKASQHQEADCICIYDAAWKTQPLFFETSNYKSLTFIQEDHLELIQQSKLTSEDDILIILVGAANNESMLNEIMDNNIMLPNYELLGSYGYGSTYYLYNDEAVSPES